VSTTANLGASAVLRNAPAMRVLGASLLGRVPLGAAPLALILFARESMSLTAAGLLVGAYTAGVAVGGPLLARLVDRWSQPPVMWSAMVVSTAGFVLVTLALPLPLAMVAGVLAGLGAPPFEACLRVLWREFLPAGALPAAYTLDIAVQETIFVAGPLVTVGAVNLLGTEAGLLTAAGLQALGTAWFATSPTVRRWRGVPTGRRHWAGALQSGRLRLLLLGVALTGAAIGATIVAATAYAEEVATSSLAGWLIAAQAFGALVGGLAYTRLRRPTRLPLIGGLMVASYLPLLILPPPAGMLPLIAVSGLGLPAMLTVTFLTVDDLAPQGTAAEAFAWVATAFSIGSAGGSALTGVLLDGTGVLRVGFLVAPVVLVLALAVFTAVSRPLALAAPGPLPAPRS
jgi:predicted MFS family arabinose efflux permease